MAVWSGKEILIIKLTALSNLVITSFLVHSYQIDGVILHFSTTGKKFDEKIYADVSDNLKKKFRKKILRKNSKNF